MGVDEPVDDDDTPICVPVDEELLEVGPEEDEEYPPSVSLPISSEPPVDEEDAFVVVPVDELLLEETCGDPAVPVDDEEDRDSTPVDEELETPVEDGTVGCPVDDFVFI